MKKSKQTFSGCGTAYEKADIVLLGNPFDPISSARTGSGFAPDVIRRASLEMDTYSFYQNRDLQDCAVCDLGNTEVSGLSNDRMFRLVAHETHDILSDRKIPVLLGGHPLITLGAVRGLCQKYPKMNLIQFGAHACLKEPSADAVLSRCVMRSCYELLGEGRIHQFCVRSGSREEFSFAARHTDIHPLGFEWLQPTIDRIRQKNVPIYLSLNLDCLDPSLFPAAENPVCSGVTFLQLLEAIRRVCAGPVVGADVTGLLPPFDQSGACACTAGLVLRELLLAMSRS